VRQKELEIERLQQQLESKKSSGSSDSSVDVCAAVELDEDPSAAYANEVGVVSDHLHLSLTAQYQIMVLICVAHRLLVVQQSCTCTEENSLQQS